MEWRRPRLPRVVDDEVVRQVVKLLIGQRLRRQRQLKNWNAGRVVRKDLWRCDAGRQALEDGLSDRRHLRQGAVDVHLGVEKYLDHSHAGQRLRFDMVDVVDGRGHLTLKVRDDPIGYLGGRQPVIGPYNAHHRQFYVREYVDRRSQDRQGAEQQDGNRQYEECVRPGQRDPNYPHVNSALTAEKSAWASPAGTTSGCGGCMAAVLMPGERRLREDIDRRREAARRACRGSGLRSPHVIGLSIA